VAPRHLVNRRGRQVLLLSLFLCAFSSSLFGYGADGHRIVGAIADEKLAGTPTELKVKELLDGIKLTEAGLLADQIKRWDGRKGPDDPKAFHLPDHPAIEKQLAAFWRANPPPDKDRPGSNDDSDKKPYHEWFHYTDVPVFNPLNYAEGKTGRSKWDVVHMISYCVRVLQGQESEKNSRAITKPVAVILLAHYVGDIHQPLHVGAEYFDALGHPCDPDQPPKKGEKPALFYETMGGNSLLLTLKSPPGMEGSSARRARLHGYWDVRTVNTAWSLLEDEVKKQSATPEEDPKPSEILKYLAAKEPVNWKLGDKVDTSGYAEAWANEILPVAREAYARLDFEEMTCKDDNGVLVASGTAAEARSPDGKTYEIWSGEVVKEELHKGGWRLADLLTRLLP
jgi:hypothetical protein